jgi:hypothetical protein
MLEHGISAFTARGAAAAVERLSHAELELLRSTYGPRELPLTRVKGASSCF